MAYSRWTNYARSLYIWASFDALHVWKIGEGEENGIRFEDGNKQDIEQAQKLFFALKDYLTSNGIEVRIRANILSMKRKK